MNNQYLIQRIFEEMGSDDAYWEKESERIVTSYQEADEKGKALLDDVFISLCGYSLKTLLEHQ